MGTKITKAWERSLKSEAIRIQLWDAIGEYIGNSRHFIRIENQELHGFATLKAMKAWLKLSKLRWPTYDYGTTTDGILEHSCSINQIINIKVHK